MAAVWPHSHEGSKLSRPPEAGPDMSRPQTPPGATAPVPGANGDGAMLGAIIATLEDAKAEDTALIDLKGKTALADAMIVTSGRSNRHVGAIADQVIEMLKQKGYGTPRVEGQPHCDWVLIDAGDRTSLTAERSGRSSLRWGRWSEKSRSTFMGWTSGG